MKNETIQTKIDQAKKEIEQYREQYDRNENNSRKQNYCTKMITALQKYIKILEDLK